MSDEPRISPDDPRLTAYALGEMDDDERSAFEAELRRDRAARAIVEDIRGLTDRMEEALAAEAGVPRPAKRRAPARSWLRRPGWLRFPQLYFVLPTVGAAVFAVVFALRPAAPEKPVLSGKMTTEFRLKAEKWNDAPPVTSQPLTDVVAGSSPDSVGWDKADFATRGLAKQPHTFGGATPITTDGKTDNADAAPSMVFDTPTKNEGSGGLALGPPNVKGTPPVVVLSGRSAPTTKEPMAAKIATERAPSPEANAKTETQAGTLAKRSPTKLGAVAAAPAPDQKSRDVEDSPKAKPATTEAPGNVTNLKRMLASGKRPSASSVKIEALVNYFPFHYAPPKDEAPLSAALEVAEAPWAPSRRLVRVGLKGREAPVVERAGANLVFLLDVSGSMAAPNRLPLVQEALRLLVAKLRPDDRVAVVTYATEAALALPSTPVAKTREILKALDGLEAQGRTNGASGIRLAYEIAKANFIAGGVNRVILCTDGDFNVGVTSAEELARLADEQAQTKVYLSVFGFGRGRQIDARLESLAVHGHGSSGYVNTRHEAERVLVEQVNGSFAPVAKDIKLEVEFNPERVASYRLVGYDDRAMPTAGDVPQTVAEGEIGPGNTLTALYEVVPAVPAAPKVSPTVVAATPSNAAARPTSPSPVAAAQTGPLLTFRVSYADPQSGERRELKFPLRDAGARFAEASADFRLAAAAAGLGMILRESSQKVGATFEDVIAWTKTPTGGLIAATTADAADDADDYRAELVEMARQAEAAMQRAVTRP